MLIKSETVKATDGEEKTVNEEGDKLQERLKQDQDNEKSAKAKLLSAKYSSFVSERAKEEILRNLITITPTFTRRNNPRRSNIQERLEWKLNKSSSPLDITEIRPYLLLCGAVALRGNILEDLNVTCVINATKELPDTPLPSSLKDNILYLRVNVDDKSDSDILSWLDLVTDIIHQVKLSSGKALIHCVAGVSRSATLCLAYLIKYEGYSLLDSYVMLKTLRDIIRPNSGFFGQLVEFEKRITGKQTVFMIHSDYASSCIPQLYEDDYYRLHLLRCQRT